MKVAVVAVGQTKFGEIWDKSLRNICTDAAKACYNDATNQTDNFNKKNIDSLFIGNMSGGSFISQGHLGPFAADAIDLSGISAVRCEGACASGSLAFREAYHTILAGKSNISMVLGAEKMTDVDPSKVLNILMEAGDAETEGIVGLTFAGLYGFMAHRHMHEFGTTREQLAAISVINHKNGLNNPFAQFRNEISIQDVLKASMIADPLGTLDCSPISDGAAAVILMNEECVEKYHIMNPVWIDASGCGTDRITFHNRDKFTELNATKIALEQIKNQGIVMKDIDILEVHDCFTINELVALEDLGFCKKGEGGSFIEKGNINLDGKIPTNTTGGLKSIGHPVGATGVRQIVDITKQIRGDSINQLKKCDTGLALNVGGIGSTVVIHVLGRKV